MKSTICEADFVATEWSTIEEKKKFLRQFEKFVRSGYKETAFPKWFYQRLSMMFGFIAHYNQRGFYDKKFSGCEARKQFKRDILAWPCYGDPAYVYSDVERLIQKRMRNRTMEKHHVEN